MPVVSYRFVLAVGHGNTYECWDYLSGWCGQQIWG
jgi:hypothetical protein